MQKLVVFIVGCLMFFCAPAQQKVEIGDRQELIYFLPDDFLTTDTTADSLANLFRSKTIVGMGEATHGTLEFGQHKSSIFKFLVQHCGYRSIIFEGSTGAFNFINDYVHTGIGNVDTLLRQQNYWIFYTAEIRSLIEWIKDFNRNKSLTDRVSIYGLDMQLPQPELWYISKRIGQSSFPGKEALQVILNPVKDYLRPERLSESTNDKLIFTKIVEVVPAVAQWFTENRFDLQKFLDEETMQLLLINIQNAGNAVKIPISDMHYRDSCMAVNVQRLQAINHTKAAIWAHNAHVSLSDPVVGYEQFRKPMGEWLRHQFGDSYYPIGFILAKGGYLAAEQIKSRKGVTFPHLRVISIPASGPAELSNVFSAVNKTNFFIDISESPNPVWGKFYRAHTIGSVYFKGKSQTYYVTPGVAFKALVYVEHTHASVQIDEFFYRTVK